MNEENGLTPLNLAKIGALDEFYDVYVLLSKLYDNELQKYQKEFGNDIKIIELCENSCRKRARVLCEPLINKYLYLFTDSYSHVFASAYSFDRFTMLECTPSRSKVCQIRIKIVSFSGFLCKFQTAVTKKLYKKKKELFPKYEFYWFSQEIDRFVKKSITDQIFKVEEYESVQIDSATEELFYFKTLSSTKCYRYKHTVVPRKLTVVTKEGTDVRVLPVHYCKECKRSFVGEKTLELFEKTYGELDIVKLPMPIYDETFDGFRSESKLHALGYNVIDGNLSEEQRHALLRTLLKHKEITYFEICATIERNIQIFSRSSMHKLAVEKWKNDLKFLGKLVIEESV